MAIAAAAAGCGGTSRDVATAPARETRVVELGPIELQGEADPLEGPYVRQAFDPREVGFVLGFRAEVVDAASGRPLPPGHLASAELRLDVNAPLLRVSASSPDLELPEGFGLPLEQVVEDAPRPWRGLSLAGRVFDPDGSHAGEEVLLRCTIDYLPAAGVPPDREPRPLYRAGLAITLGPGVLVESDRAEARDEAPRRYTERRDHWLVPPGSQVARQRFRDVVPVRGRVHYAVANVAPPVRSLRLLRADDGSELLRLDATAGAAGDGSGPRIPPFADPAGVEILPGTEYVLEATADNRGAGAVPASAALELFWEPEGGERLTYPPPSAKPGVTASRSGPRP